MFDIHGPWLVRAAPAARIVKYSQKEKWEFSNRIGISNRKDNDDALLST